METLTTLESLEAGIPPLNTVSSSGGDPQREPTAPELTTFYADPAFSDPVALALFEQGAPAPMHQARDQWAQLLQDHPDQQLVTWFLHGLQYGFLLGSSLPAPPDATRPNGHLRNNQSAIDHADTIDQAIADDIDAGRNLGPFDACPSFQDRAYVNPLGAAVKRSFVHPFVPKVRKTTDMSQSGVNSTIHPSTATLRYISFEDICNLLESLPPQAHCFIVDIKSAFRNLRIAPQDLHKCVFYWRNNYKFYVDIRLCFGVSTGPAIWSLVAKLLLYVIQKQCAACKFLVLIDDNLGAAPSLVTAKEAFDIFQRLAALLGVPIALDKLVSPCRMFIFVGILWDLSAKRASLPESKSSRLIQDVQAMLDKRTVRLAELESIVGFLAFCARLTPFGFLYLRQCYSFLAAVSQPYLIHRTKARNFRYVTVPSAVRADLRWWLQCTMENRHFASVPFTFPRERAVREADFIVATDSSPKGFGGHWAGRFFVGHWPENLIITPEAQRQDPSLSTGLTEISAVLAAVTVFGEHWKGKTVVCLCDNDAAVKAYHRRSSTSLRITQALKTIISLSIEMHVTLSVVWIPGPSNFIADFLSRIDDLALSHDDQEHLRRLQLHSRSALPDALVELLQQL